MREQRGEIIWIVDFRRRVRPADLIARARDDCLVETLPDLLEFGGVGLQIAVVIHRKWKRRDGERYVRHGVAII